MPNVSPSQKQGGVSPQSARLGDARSGRVDVLGVHIDSVNPDSATSQIIQSALAGSGGYVCVTGVHGVMESRRNAELLGIHNRSLLTVPDGMPMVWVGRARGHHEMRRVYGPDLMLSVCEASVPLGVSHFFCGGAEGICGELAARLTERFPGLQVAGMWTPPFRTLTEEEREQLARDVTKSRATIMWIGLSTPKQERLMSEMTNLLPGVVMLGVGAAFDIHAGRSKQAPRWIQASGLEWAYRLYREPRRLWRRYLKNNPEFVIQMLVDSVRMRVGRKSR